MGSDFGSPSLPGDDDLSSLFDDDGAGEKPSASGEEDDQETAGQFMVGGKEYRFGRGRVTGELLENLQDGQHDYLGHTIYKAWSGNVSALDVLKKHMSSDTPALKAFVNAFEETAKAVAERKAKMPKADFETAAKEIPADKAEGLVKKDMMKVCNHAFETGLPFDNLKNDLDLGSASSKSLSLRYASIAINDLRQRFPEAQILKVLKCLTLYPMKPKKHNVLGCYFVYSRVISWGSDFKDLRDDGEKWRKGHPFVLMPGCGTVPSNSYKYAANKGTEAANVFWHEVAHSMYSANWAKWREARKQASKQFGFTACDVSKYATKNNNEYHSEVVGLMALPNYEQGSLPEPIERYVYEEVFGMEKGTWKKRESIWRPKDGA